jgi:O-antigen/teichoic acid export membrane protein
MNDRKRRESMIRPLFRDSVIYTVPTVISQGLAFFLIPLYTRVLSPADYGTLDMLMVSGNFVRLTVALEVSQGVARYYLDEKDHNRKVLYASTAFWFTLACYTIFLGVTLVFSRALSQMVMGVEGLEAIFQIGMGYLWLNGLFCLMQNQFRWELRSKNYAIVSLLVAVTTASVSVELAYVFHRGLVGILYGMLAGSLVGCLYGLWSLRKSFRFRFQWAYLKDMLGFSMPLVPSGIAVFISHYIDRLMINHYLSLHEVGLYGMGFRVASIVGLVMVGFNSALTPLIYANYRNPETPQQLAVIFRVFLSCALLMFLGLSFFAREILWVLTTPEYYSATKVVTFLVPAILLSNMYIFAPGIDITKQTYWILWINLGGAILHTCLNWFLIPQFGIMGASAANFLGYVSVFTVYMILSQNLYPVPHHWSTLGISVAVAVVLALWIPQINLGSAWNIILKVTVLLGTALLFMATGLVRMAALTKFIE